MLILHMADLHLGRTLHECPLFADQKQMLDAALGYIVGRHVDVLLIAGDVYDRSIPQPEAIALFDDFLNRVFAASPSISVIVIPGNHDSAARLSFGSGLLERAGLHIRARNDVVPEPIAVLRDGLKVNFWALPYMAADALEKTVGGIKKRIGTEGKTAVGTELNVLVAHCFVSGCLPGDSERAVVGLAEELPSAVFDGFDYVALGHLHRRQQAGPVARYPGSPLAYSFAEAEASPEKGFLLIGLNGRGKGSEAGTSASSATAGSTGPAFTEEFLPVTPLHRLVRIKGLFARLCAAGTGAGPDPYAGCRNDYIEAILTDPSESLDARSALARVFPNLLAVRQLCYEQNQQTEAQGLSGRGSMPAAAPPAGPEGAVCAVQSDFRSFYKEMTQREPSPETEALFAELLKEAQNKENGSASH